MKYIGVFDSGIGGLTTVKAIKRLLPNENIVFLADSANMPYGTKSNDEIISFALKDVQILSQFDLKALIIACNTADSLSLNIISKNYSFPVFGVINPAAKQAAKISNNKRIGILATKSTINNGKYEEQLLSINPNITVFNLASYCLASMIENGDFINDSNNFTHTICSYLDYFISNDCDTLILGCTHYDVVKQLCQEKSNMNIISSSRAVVNVLKTYLKKNQFQEKDSHPDIKYFCTGNADDFTKIGKNIIPDMIASEISI